MDFEPGPEERAATERAAAFIAEVLPTLPNDGSGFFRGATSTLGERGFLEEPSMLRTVVAAVEMSRASASLGIILSHDWIFATALHRFGGPPRLVESARRGGTLGCVALSDIALPSPTDVIHSEAAGGSLSGVLPMVLGGALAARAVVLCRDLSGGSPRLMLVDLGATAVQRSTSAPSLGLVHAPRATLELRGVPLSACDVLSDGEDALAQYRGLIDAQRILTAAVAVGLSRRAIDATKTHLARLGRRSSQSTEFIFSDMITSFDAAWVSVLHASWLRDTGTGHSLESSGAKLIATRAATKITHDAIGVCRGSTEDESLERAYLDARVLEMHAGTEAMQVDTMASTMLGEL